MPIEPGSVVHMGMRVPHPAIMSMRMDVRHKMQPVALFETAELPQRRGEPPRQEEHADDEVAPNSP
jgi:hypothetical protein